MSDDDKSAAWNCIGIFSIKCSMKYSVKVLKVSKKKRLGLNAVGLYAAHSTMKKTQDKLSLANIEHSLGGKKFLSMYLTENGMSEEEVNKKSKKMIEMANR